MAEPESSAVENATPLPSVESIEVDPPVKDEDHEMNEDLVEDGDPMDTGIDGPEVTPDQYKALRNVCEHLHSYKIKIKGDEDYYPSNLFRRIPNKRNLPDYYEIIKEPTAISTLKQKIQTKKYTGVPEFVRDFALIVHNAQVYNRPNSQPVRDVLLLKQEFEQEMKKLVDSGLIKAEETVFPDLGPIPDATPEPDPVSEEDEDDGEDEGDEDDEDEDADADDSDDERRKRRSRRGTRTSLAGRKHPREEDEDMVRGAEDSRKRRGRPPRVDTPMEARIKAVLKGIRKPKDRAGNLKIRHFEKLPDKQQFPHYFQEIKEPIALDAIKRKAKRKKYTSLEQFERDIDLMFNNAMEYNEDASDIYKDAVDLKKEAHSLLEAEKAKPDDEYLMEDGRRPLPNGILFKNELWKVGDWVHIQNPNDVTKPIVAQIYRTWEDNEAQQWVNACWYYRPEQTVHHFEKHFYPNEVVKTGQYRDHRIEEIVDRCFVMFFTRYSRGRPRDIGDKEVYVCEARYNEEKHKMNKIKTWASCLPDEVRDKDYEMDLFDAPKKIKKVPSPLRHLLKEDAKETDELPQPEWGQPNAPPLVGGVHCHPRDENQSPPPEPTPPPPTPPPPAKPPQPTMLPNTQSRPGVEAPTGMTTSSNAAASSPSANPQASTYQPGNVSATPSYGRHTPYQSASATHPYATAAPQTPGQAHGTPFTAQQQLHPPPALAAAHPTNYAPPAISQNYSRPPIASAQVPQYSYASASAPSVRVPEVFVLKDTANEAIPKHIRDQFPQDDSGRVLFFTTPPQVTRRTVQGRTDGDKRSPLQHTAAYLAAKFKRQIEERDQKAATAGIPRNYEPPPHGYFGEERDPDGRIKADPVKAAQIRAEYQKQTTKEAEERKERIQALLVQALKLWIERMNEGTKRIYENLYGPDWEARLHEAAKDEVQENPKVVERRKAMDEFMKNVREEPKYMTQIHKDLWTGLYLDDYDPRYGF